MKLRCKLCGWIIEGDKKGTCISCYCGHCYIDETEHYTRWGGEPKDIEVLVGLKDYMELKKISEQLSREDVSQMVVNMGIPSTGLEGLSGKELREIVEKGYKK